MEDQNSTKELDLIDIIRICWGWFVKFICRPIVFLLKFVVKKWWVGVIAVLLGVAVSYAVYRICPIYTGRITFKTNVCNSSDFVSDIRRLTKVSAEDKAESLSIPVKDAVKIKGIWAHYLCYIDSVKSGFVIDEFDNLAGKGYVVVPNMFAVEVAAFDKRVFDVIQDGVLHYINSNAFYASRNKQRLDYISSTISSIESEVKSLDSTRNNLNWTSKMFSAEYIGTPNQNIIAAFSPTVLSREIMSLNERETALSNDLVYSPSVAEVVSPMKFDDVPSNHILFTWYVYAFIFLLLGYAISLVVVYRRQISDFFNK